MPLVFYTVKANMHKANYVILHYGSAIDSSIRNEMVIYLYHI